jgi:FkbM family methyltransferase
MGTAARISSFVRRSLNTVSKRSQFNHIMRANKLRLDFALNKEEITTLIGIFSTREYADWFPFYQNAVIVDIGAHYGYFSSFASINSGPHTKIVAVEPSSRNFSALKRNLEASGINNVTPLHRAIAKTNGTISLSIGSSVNNTIIATNVPCGRSVTETVQCETLEYLFRTNGLNHVDFVKLDCEGAEYEIFETTPQAIFDRITTLSMEFHDLKSEKYNANWLASKLFDVGFDIKKFEYSPTGVGKNFGKLIASRLLK